VSGEVAELADKVALDKELGDGVRPAAGEGGEEPDEQPATTATANASTAARILMRPIMSAVSFREHETCLRKESGRILLGR
jgi:hypothetical protein